MLSSPRESIIFLPFGFEGFTVSAPHPEFRFFQINRSNARIDHPFDLLLLHVTDETLSRHNIGDQVPVRNLPPLAVALALFEVIFHPIPFSKKIILIISPSYPCHKLGPVPFVSPRLNALLQYNVQEGKEDDVGNIVHKYEPIPVQNVEPTLGIGAPTDKVFMIEEAQRPGEYMTAFEDEHGTYIMNSKDLRAIAHVERLTKMGVHSLKIEGRTKSFYYCARTAQVYRKAIDDAAAGKPFDTSLLETLEGLAHRGYTEGFLRRHTHDDYQNYEYGYSVSDRQQFVGEFTGERKGELAAVAVKNKFSVGDSLELMTPQGNINFTLEHMENAKGEAMPVAPGDGYTVWLPVPQDLELNYALLMRNFSGETTRNPHGK